MFRLVGMSRRALTDALIFLVLGAGCVAEAYRLDLTKDPRALHQELRPGLYVFLLGAVLLITGIAHFVINRKSVEAEHAPESLDPILKVLGILVALGAYALLINLVGYPAASFLFFIAVFRIFGVEAWIRNMILSAVFAAVYQVLFAHYFGVQFPRGMWLEYVP